MDPKFLSSLPPRTGLKSSADKPSSSRPERDGPHPQPLPQFQEGGSALPKSGRTCRVPARRFNPRHFSLFPRETCLITTSPGRTSSCSARHFECRVFIRQPSPAGTAIEPLRAVRLFPYSASTGSPPAPSEWNHPARRADTRSDSPRRWLPCLLRHHRRLPEAETGRRVAWEDYRGGTRPLDPSARTIEKLILLPLLTRRFQRWREQRRRQTPGSRSPASGCASPSQRDAGDRRSASNPDRVGSCTRRFTRSWANRH